MTVYFCEKCDNLCVTDIDSGTLKLQCTSCGFSVNNDNKVIVLQVDEHTMVNNTKNPKDVFNYPISKLVYMNCKNEKCKANILAEENTEKIYFNYSCGECGQGFTIKKY